MDNPEEIREQEIVDKYINECARYYCAQVVAFYDDRGKLRIGVVSDRNIAYKKYTNSDKEFCYITYDIITPNSIIRKDEIEIFEAAALICLHKFCVKSSS